MKNATVSLNGSWQFRRSSAEGVWRAATVPGCVHTDLRRHSMIPDPFWGTNELSLEWIEHTGWEYRRTFTVARSLLDQPRVELVAEGLDTVAAISLNGKPVARVENMFIEHRINIRDALRAGANTIRIVFESPMGYIKSRSHLNDSPQWNDPVGGCNVIRKEQCSFGWDWGPRLPTTGIFRAIRIEAGAAARIEGVHVSVKLEAARAHITCMAHPRGMSTTKARYRTSLRYDGAVVAQADGLQLDIRNPRLWWPNGLGAQPLYELTVELLDRGEVTDTWRRMVGIRTIELDRHEDTWGESFQFKVNGVAFFAKGANWVPAHSFQSSVSSELYRDLLDSAVSAHMNMLRVWGGGVYENDEFYRMCDERGLMIWHDFMFACSRYPATREFVSSVRREAEHNVLRLAHHPCMALWCGNNEIEQMARDIVAKPSRVAAYRALFEQTLPEVVARLSPSISYWPSSPHDPEGYEKRMGGNSDRGGDAHYWGVWHGRERIAAYEDQHFRFVSEYGMQSYPSIETSRQFADPATLNVFDPVMENHQKNGRGNTIIFDYISQAYRFPRDHAALVYQSQVNQAHALRTAIEHHRREMPRTMGSLYWQINDCWPVASWSSIEFGGHWKAAHFQARRSFSPVLLSAKRTGGEWVYSINRQKNTVEGCELHTVCDSVTPVNATLHWTLYHLDGKVIDRGSKRVRLRYGESTLQKSLKFKRAFEQYGKNQLYLHSYLAGESTILSQTTTFFTAPRMMELPREQVTPLIKRIGPSRYRLTFRSRTFQHAAAFHIDGARYRASDNWFDLYPSIPHSVELILETDMPQAQLRERLQVQTMVQSY